MDANIKTRPPKPRARQSRNGRWVVFDAPAGQMTMLAHAATFGAAYSGFMAARRKAQEAQCHLS